MIDLMGAPVGVNEYAKAATDTHTIYAFDLVEKVAASADVEGQPIPTPSVQTYSQSTPGTDLILGAALNYGAGSEATWHTIVDDPAALFEAQCDDTTNVTVANHVGKNANVLNTAQTNGTLISAMTVDASTILTGTTSKDLRVRDLYRVSGNAEGAYAIVEVLIIHHANAQGSAGV
jgi:hypothetical protein